MDKISVIVPIYNVEKYLGECLDSIINQTYENLEIILVNDGTKDNSLAIAEEYAKKDHRIMLFSKENGGLSDARNFGLTKAGGKYIGFVDSDDKILPTMFETLYKMISEDDSDIAMVDFIRSDEVLKDEKVVVRRYGKEVFNDIMLDKINAHVWDKLFKKELFDNVSFPKGMHFEDLAVFYKIAYKINSFVLSNEKLYWYRVDNVHSITKDEKNRIFNGKCIAKIYREKTLFAYENDIAVKEDVLKMAVKYNTDCYRNIKKLKDEDLPIIKSYIKVYYKDIMRNFKVDPVKKLFTFLIYHNLY